MSFFIYYAMSGQTGFELALFQALGNSSLNSQMTSTSPFGDQKHRFAALIGGRPLHAMKVGLADEMEGTRNIMDP